MLKYDKINTNEKSVTLLVVHLDSIDSTVNPIQCHYVTTKCRLKQTEGAGLYNMTGEGPRWFLPTSYLSHSQTNFKTEENQTGN